MFWDKIGDDTHRFIHNRPPCSSGKLQHKVKCEPVRVPTGWDPNMVFPAEGRAQRESELPSLRAQ